MTASSPERPAWRTASQRLFVGVLALLFAWHATPMAPPVTAAPAAVHIAPAIFATAALREATKLSQPGARLSASRSHAGPDGAPPPALPTLAGQITPPAPLTRAGWPTTYAPVLPRRTRDLYSARAPPMTA